MRSYPCIVVGLPYEGRARYVSRNVEIGAALTLHREPDNPYDTSAVAVYHGRTKIGYLAAEKHWVCRSLDEGDTHVVQVDGFNLNDDGELSSVAIRITVTNDGLREPVQADFAAEPNPVIATIGEELRILAAVAKAGGRFVKAESDLITKYAKIRMSNVGVHATEGQLSTARNWLKRHVPKGTEIAQSVGRLTRSDSIDALIEVCGLVAEADKRIAEEESDMVLRIRAILEYRRKIGFA
jgi:hypothetical protein